MGGEEHRRATLLKRCAFSGDCFCGWEKPGDSAGTRRYSGGGAQIIAKRPWQRFGQGTYRSKALDVCSHNQSHGRVASLLKCPSNCSRRDTNSRCDRCPMHQVFPKLKFVGGSGVFTETTANPASSAGRLHWPSTPNLHASAFIVAGIAEDSARSNFNSCHPDGVTS